MILNKRIFIIVFLIVLFQCKKETPLNIDAKMEVVKTRVKELGNIKFTNGFDFPVGKPDAVNYYNAQKFQENDHLGDDWNGKGGGNTDLGDPIYAIANGYVSFAKDLFSGWGKVIKIIHYNSDKTQVESLYGHCNEILIKEGDYVIKGKKIATIGTADGLYLAHLHFEIRDKIDLPVGPGYSTETEGYLDPTNYINKNR